MKKTKNTKPKTGTRIKDCTFIGRNGESYYLTKKQHSFCIEYLKGYGNAVDAIVNAGYDVFYRDKKGNITDNVNYNLARSMASENLRKPNITEFIATKLKDFGFDDENVELQHLFLINQFDDLSSKNRAIDMWYKLLGKYPADKVESKVEHTIKGISKLSNKELDDKLKTIKNRKDTQNSSK